MTAPTCRYCGETGLIADIVPTLRLIVDADLSRGDEHVVLGEPVAADEAYDGVRFQCQGCGTDARTLADLAESARSEHRSR